MFVVGGKVYEGELKSGEFNGKGSLKFEDGRHFEGSFLNGKKDGFGKMSWPDGRAYEGEWS